MRTHLRTEAWRTRNSRRAPPSPAAGTCHDCLTPKFIITAVSTPGTYEYR